MSLVARHLEANGLPTVVVGSARDVVETCGVARFLFSDLPLGNSCGVPYDEAMQHDVAALALDLLESARHPRTTVQTPFAWPGGDDWKERYARVDESNREALRRQGERRRAQQQQAATAGRKRGG